MLKYNLIQNYKGVQFEILKEDPNIYFRYQNVQLNYPNYLKIIPFLGLDNLDLNNKNILVTGLGLGVIPQWIIENNSTSTVDVIEMDQELITSISDMGHLSPSINIISGDANTFIPTSNYDLIIFDHFAMEDENTLPSLNTLQNHYNNYINIGGIIKCPEMISYSYIKE